jgi:hypothetical protein
MKAETKGEKKNITGSLALGTRHTLLIEPTIDTDLQLLETNLLEPRSSLQDNLTDILPILICMNDTQRRRTQQRCKRDRLFDVFHLLRTVIQTQQ